MATYTTPYTTSEIDKLPVSIDDIRTVNELYLDDESKTEISNITGLSYYTIGRIISSIESGLFDDILTDNPITSTNNGGGTVINGGVTVEIHNYYNNTTETINTPPKPVKRVTPTALSNWSKKIRARDNYTCICCGKYDKAHMEAHHIKPKSLFPDLALDEDNGVCICQSCHKKYNNRYTPKDQNLASFIRFISLGG